LTPQPVCSKRFSSIKALALRHGVSIPAIYYWLRTCQIPTSLVSRKGGLIEIEEVEFVRLLKAGKLRKRNRRRSPRIADLIIENFTLKENHQ
jgi:hypothetical protein